MDKANWVELTLMDGVCVVVVVVAVVRVGGAAGCAGTRAQWSRGGRMGAEARKEISLVCGLSGKGFPVIDSAWRVDDSAISVMSVS